MNARLGPAAAISAIGTFCWAAMKPSVPKTANPATIDIPEFAIAVIHAFFVISNFSLKLAYVTITPNKRLNVKNIWEIAAAQTSKSNNAVKSGVR